MIYKNASFSRFFKIKGKLVFSFELAPSQHIFSNKKNGENSVKIRLYKDESNCFTVHKAENFGEPSSNTFYKLLDAALYYPELAINPQFYETLAQNGELVASDKLLLATIGEYEPKELKILHIFETYRKDETLDHIVISNAKQVYGYQDEDSGFSVAVKENTLQLIGDLEVLESTLTKSNIKEELQNILTFCAKKLMVGQFNDAVKVIFSEIGKMGLKTPDNIEFPFDSLKLNKAPKVTIIKKDTIPSTHPTKYIGINEGGIREFDIYGEKVASTNHLNQTYELFLIEGMEYSKKYNYILVQKSQSKIKDFGYVFIGVYRFYAFNNNGLADSLELNLPLDVCLELQSQLNLPCKELIHGHVLKESTAEQISHISINDSKSISVLGRHLTSHSNNYAQIDTVVSEGNINLIISLKPLSNRQLDEYRKLYPKAFKHLGLEDLLRVANCAETPYICISSAAEEIDFLSFASHFFNPFSVEDSGRNQLEACTQILYSHIDKLGLAPHVEVYNLG